MTTSRELSQKLFNAGYMGPHDEIWLHSVAKEGKWYRAHKNMVTSYHTDRAYPAYTTDELWAALPEEIPSGGETQAILTLTKERVCYLESWRDHGEIWDAHGEQYFQHEAPAEALGQLVLWCIENGHMEAGEMKKCVDNCGSMDNKCYADDCGRSVEIKIPPILDACCGGRMFWYDKENPNAIFMDNREVEKGAFQNNWNPNWCISPDIIADFRCMPFADESFTLVVFDPPHLTSGSMNGVINKKYGLLNKDTWQQDILAGFNECWRVLKFNGVLIFKWNEANIKAKDIIDLLPENPLFGDFTGKTGKTIWMVFLKLQETTS